MNRVFVYGTLKSDQPSHRFIATIAEMGRERCRFVGVGRTESKWPLVIASKYNIPFLLDIEGVGHVSTKNNSHICFKAKPK